MDMRKRVISTEKAPKAIGPYSQAVEADGWVFCSGQIPLDPATGMLLEGDVREQTRRIMQNLAGVLEAAGASMDGVVKCTIYVQDLADFAAINEIYGSFFSKDGPPARATVQVAALPKGACVEIDAIARKKGA
jgi:2-iminobutanoate/2-iminopropanoate deaminase